MAICRIFYEVHWVSRVAKLHPVYALSNEILLLIQFEINSYIGGIWSQMLQGRLF